MLKFNRKCLSDLIYIQLNLDEVFKDASLYREVQRNIIKKALLFQLSNNKNYKDYYDSFGLKEITEKNFNISLIPLLPSSLFKHKYLKLNSVNEEEIIKYCTSSGTQGSVSVVPRDEVTLTNFLGSVTSTISCLLALERTGNHKAFILGPTPEESGDLWFSYVISSMALNFMTEYFEHNDNFDIANAALKIEEADKHNIEVIIIGPPFRIIELCKYLNRMKFSISLKGNSYIISAGGWKDKQDEVISRKEYMNIVKNTFKLNSFFIRDSYNMVELNTVISECEYHEKHVLPWVEVLVRDPKTNNSLGDDKLGILSFYDGSSLSYPCFILSEDYGITNSGKCECGRFGKRLKIVKRMERIESRGCALKMAFIEKKLKNSNASNRFYKSYFRCPDLYLEELKHNGKEYLMRRCNAY